MLTTHGYRWLADGVLVLHVGIVSFIVGGLLLVVIGNLRGWRWVNRRAFRIAHLAAIAIVVGEAWFGAICPLTTLEMWLRAEARSAVYEGSFIEHWLQRLLYYTAPGWVFGLAYTLFGLVVAATWWYFPPERRTPRR
jgi:polyferredoxin